ncbi:hypothetical protein [Isoalcanivorax indicus]|uniref:hypothetical protein n=1 Tax=Isoalcanivorax indicus TaxID=2202653 RepID=UPI000DB9FFC3|nr:hypothetical protein [Isoalcanivorax indicus]
MNTYRGALALGALIAITGCGGSSGGGNGGGGGGDPIRHAEALLGEFSGSYTGPEAWATIDYQAGVGDSDVWKAADTAYMAEVSRVLMAEINRVAGDDVIGAGQGEDAFSQSEPCTGQDGDPPPGDITLQSGSVTFDDYCIKDITLSHPGPYVLNGTVTWTARPPSALPMPTEWDTVIDDLSVDWGDGGALPFTLDGAMIARDDLLASAWDIDPAFGADEVLRVLYADSARDQAWDYQAFHPDLGKFRMAPNHGAMPCDEHFNAVFQISTPDGADFEANSNDPTQCVDYLVNGEDSLGAPMANEAAGWLDTFF